MKYFLAILFLTSLSIVEAQADSRCNRIALGVKTCGTGNHTHWGRAEEFYGDLGEGIGNTGVGYQTGCASQYSTGWKVGEYLFTDGEWSDYRCDNPTAEKNRDNPYINLGEGDQNPFRKNKTGNKDYEG